MHPFWCIHNPEVSLLGSLSPSDCTYETTRELPDGLSWNFISRILQKYSQAIPNSSYIMQF
jgi:hypothetical protein